MKINSKDKTTSKINPLLYSVLFDNYYIIYVNKHLERELSTQKSNKICDSQLSNQSSGRTKTRYPVSVSAWFHQTISAIHPTVGKPSVGRRVRMLHTPQTVVMTHKYNLK